MSIGRIYQLIIINMLRPTDNLWDLIQKGNFYNRVKRYAKEQDERKNRPKKEEGWSDRIIKAILNE